MKTYSYTGRTTTLDTLKGLLKAVWQMIKFFLIAIPITFLIGYYADLQFTKTVCPNIVDPQVKLQTKC